MMTLAYALMTPVVVIAIIYILQLLLFFIIVAEISVGSQDIAGRMRAGNTYDTAIHESYFTRSPFSAFCKITDENQGYDFVVENTVISTDSLTVIATSCNYSFLQPGPFSIFGNQSEAKVVRRTLVDYKHKGSN